mgnify:FL=1
MNKTKKLLAIILVGIITCTSLSACGSKSSSRSSKDTLSVGQTSDPRGLDPALIDDVESVRVTFNIYEGLLKYSKDSVDIEPCLAKSWEVSDDGISYIFHLREDVKFHDGTEFNAEAVKFNIDRQLPGQKTSDMPYAESVYGVVDNVEVIDKYTVKINLKNKCTPFLSNLAMPLGAPIASPKALQESNNNLNENPVGTGPYKFVRWDKSQNVILVKNDEYWGEKANITNLIFKIISDQSARAVALTNGEVDIIPNADVHVVDQIKNGGCKILDNEGMNVFYAAFNTTSSTCKDAKIRRAIVQAINVPELTETITKGYATAATSILPTFVDGYDESIQQTQYDPEAAKKTLNDAGVKSIHFITHTANGQEPAEAIQGYLSKIGIDCKIDAYDWATYKDKVKNGDYDMCYYGWTGDNGDPDNFLNILSVSDYSINVSRYNNQVYNAGIEKGLVTPRGEERNRIYTDLEKIQAQDAVLLPLWHKRTLSGYRPNINNFVEHATGTVSFKDITKS